MHVFWLISHWHWRRSFSLSPSSHKTSKKVVRYEKMKSMEHFVCFKFKCTESKLTILWSVNQPQSHYSTIMCSPNSSVWQIWELANFNLYTSINIYLSICKTRRFVNIPLFANNNVRSIFTEAQFVGTYKPYFNKRLVNVVLNNIFTNAFFFLHFYCSWSVGFGFGAGRKAASSRNSVQICLFMLFHCHWNCGYWYLAK